MNILVIDAQGGGLGRQLIRAVREKLPEAEITAVGTNSTATAAMLKEGADAAATGRLFPRCAKGRTSRAKALKRPKTATFLQAV